MVKAHQQVLVALDIQSAEYVVQVPWTDLACSAGGFHLGSEVDALEFFHVTM